MNSFLSFLYFVLHYFLLPTSSLESLKWHLDLADSLAFTENEFTGTIPENSLGQAFVHPSLPHRKIGIQVNETILQEGLDIKYRIFSGNRENFFKAESKLIGDFVFLSLRLKTGDFQFLNREAVRSYVLEIRAIIKDSHKRKLSSKLKTRVTIEVLDTNDLDPFFNESKYTFTVREDHDLYKEIGRVHAEDADEGIHGEIYYALSPTQQNDEKYFAIDPLSGSLSLLERLISIRKSVYMIQVSAFDRGFKSSRETHRDVVDVSVLVTPVNLHDPLMRIIHLPEVIEMSNTDIVAIIVVSDEDEGRHGVIRSLVISAGDPEAHFRIRRGKEVNEYNLEVLQLLDREIHPYGYNLTLEVTDDGIPVRKSVAQLHVPLGDVNDHPPVFDEEVYEVHVKESSPVNTSLLRIRVSDEDFGKNAFVSLKITGGNKGGVFEVHSHSGVLFLSKPLDAEERSTYTLTVSALDHAHFGMRQQSSAKIKVFVIDVNDNSPFFDSELKTVFFNENEPEESHVTVVRARDADTGDNGMISYSIANIDFVPFEIDAFTGEIKSTLLIDYEKDPRIYKLGIRASDWGQPFSRQSQMVLTIQIENVNDNRPIFQRIHCVGKIPRNTPVKSAILTLSAIDFDSNDIISYRFEGGNDDLCFHLDGSKGTLSLLCDLRTLPMRSRLLNVSASDGTHFSDINSVLLFLTEEETKGSVVSSFLGSPDESLFECRETDVTVQYKELLASRSLHSHSTIFKGQEEDFETQNSAFFPQDNVHRPEFLSGLPSVLKIKESTAVGTILLKVRATDKDLGYNGILLYVISFGDTDSVFNIDTETGDLSVYGPLDRENTPEYNLNITVFDQGLESKSSSFFLSILLEDVNDNPPVFFKSAFSFSFPENTEIGTSVVTLFASDADEGLNAHIVYSLQTETNTFSINSKTGLLVVSSPLDRETKETYDLVIRATDGSLSNPLFSTATVIVSVLDINDVAPIFTSKTLTVKVEEDLPPFSLLGVIHARDPDSGDGGLISFSLSEPSEFFSLDSVSGALSLKTSLDFETKQIFNLSIKAMDNSAPYHSSFSHFVIEVIDVNENLHRPTFESFCLLSKVPENNKPGSFVTELKAVDEDTGLEDSKVSYLLTRGDGLGVFFIDDFGILRTSFELDYETKSYYWLTIMATDHGTIPLSTFVELYIQVLNVNDNVPLSLEPIYYVSLLENSKAYTSIVTIEAEDPDPETYMTFEILGGNSLSLFRIDSESGSITTTNKNVDREAGDEHVLEILISDNGTPSLNSTTTVLISILDVNDNKPFFLDKIMQIQLPELFISQHEFLNDEEKEGDKISGKLNKLLLESEEEEELNWKSKFNNSSSWHSVDSVSHLNVGQLFRALAKDKDDDHHRSFLRYSMKGEDDSKDKGLVIHSSSGIVYALKSLEGGQTIHLLLRVEDEGGKFDLSRVSLKIYSRVSSLSSPIVKPLFPLSVFESESIGHLVSVIDASDPDEEPLHFEIVRGNDEGDFSIHPEKGTLFLAQRLSASRRSFYNLTLKVSDGSHETISFLALNVLPDSESRPTFSQKSFSVSLSENSEIESFVIQLNVSANVSSSSSSSLVFYSFHGAQDPRSLTKFKISRLEGIIRLRERLDMETCTSHTLIVMAKNQGGPGRATFIKVRIHVVDSNDHAPLFPEKVLTARLTETSREGTNVLQLRAVDSDKGDNGRIFYSLISGNHHNSFRLEKESGILRVNRKLNMELQGEYMLSVRAFDNGVPSLSSTVFLHIHLQLPNESPPIFLQSLYTAQIDENIHRGETVMTFKARSYSSLRFSIESGNDDEFGFTFSINSFTGVLTTTIPLDYETLAFYNLTIRATNTLGAFSLVSALIYVIDVNDNSPILLESHYEGWLEESAPIGSFVLKSNSREGGVRTPLVIKASDSDSGYNSLLLYDILETFPKKYFKIDDGTGAIRSLSTLDAEHHSVFSFTVRVFDRGTPRRASEKLANVTIFIKDENDHRPTFEKKEYDVTLSLPAFPLTFLAQVQAQDLDVSSHLVYSLIHSSNLSFSIDSLSGIITVAKLIESWKNEIVRVRVTDGVFSDETHLAVSIEESFDASGLAFSKKEYSAFVYENTTKREKILFLSVLGASLHENILFSIYNPSSYFTIGSSSGVLQTTGIPFDREMKDSHDVIVRAKSLDSEAEFRSRIATVVVKVSVIDTNDNKPIFVNTPYYAVITRESSPESTVFIVEARDADSGINAQIIYQLVKGSGEYFRVHRESGVISLRKNLRESSLVSDSKDEYKLTLAAIDGGTPSQSEEIDVIIKVVQKSIPSFRKTLYRTSVFENVDLSFPILLVEAVSSKPKGTLLYTIIEGNQNETFSLDYRTGALFVSYGLDYETQAHYQLVIQASESFDNEFASVIVLLEVIDVNDLPPKFSQEFYSASVPESLTLGSKVLVVNARDGDTDFKDSEISYTLFEPTGTFSIDSLTGVTSLVSPLDFELRQSISFVVMAFDGKESSTVSYNASASVRIFIENVNDNPPEFEEKGLVVMKLSDEALRGQFIGRIIGRDKDDDFSTSNFSNLTYRIIGGNPFGVFGLGEQTGILILNQNLRPELLTVKEHRLDISLSDGIYSSSSSTILIQILYSNRFSPTFSQKFITISVFENVSQNTLLTSVLAIDKDPFDEISYSIFSESLNGLFVINETNGSLFNLQVFDREKIPIYEIPILASDKRGKHGFTILKLLLLDVNDNAPFFSLTEYKGNIYANSSIGSDVLYFQAFDPDENDVCSYSIYESNLGNSSFNVSELFQIGRESGRLVVKGSLETYSNQIYQFFVRTSDGLFHVDVPVQIYIMSPLDAPPFFEKGVSASRLFIPENTPIGTVILSLVGVSPENDDDGDDEKISSFSSSLVYKSLSYLKVCDIDESSGQVYVSSPLDRESLDFPYRFAFSVETDSSPPLRSIYELTLGLIDENDNVPTFLSSSYSLSLSDVSTDNLAVLQVLAKDPDFGSNGELTYSLEYPCNSSSSLLSIDAQSGWISLVRALDSESLSEIRCRVNARDGGHPSYSTSVPLLISYHHLKDETGVPFSQRLYSVAVNEGAPPGTIIFDFKMTSGKENSLQNIQLYITKGDPRAQFMILQSTSELLVLKKLDRETQRTYTLEVVSIDSGLFVTSTKVTIEILDENDSPPICQESKVVVELLENVSSGTFVTQVVATDADEGENAKQNYILQGVGNEAFLLDESGFLVTALPSLDREKKEIYDLRAIVTDATNINFSCSTQILVVLTDVNDNAPEFIEEKDLFVSVLEDISPGSIVTKVSARDLDLGVNKHIRYALLSHDSIFELNNISGILRLKVPLDRETKAVYNVTVRATDLGVPSLFTDSQVIIVVLDINDNPPDFASKVYFTTVDENASIGSVVLQVFASSKDEGINAIISYSILAGNKESIFSIDSHSGSLTLLRPLDYEETKGYYLTIQATDGGTPSLHSLASVNISVNDVNDNAPLFSKSSYTATISESSEIGVEILRCHATDKDTLYDYGLITYSILSGDTQNVFSIHEKTGALVVAQPLDRENRASYVLEVSASDPYSLFSSVHIHINVSDVNDSPPVFSQENYTVFLPENKDLDSLLLHFDVTDADMFPNKGPFTFDIRGGNEGYSFRVLQDGTLRTASKFQSSRKRDYALQIRVFDNGTPPLYSDTLVNVVIIQESIYPPIAFPLEISINSYLDDFPGATIGTLRASDQDPHDELSYTLSHDSFEIDFKSGVIKGLPGLDVGVYTLNVSIHDGKFTTYVSNRVTVHLISDEVLESSLIISLKNLTSTSFISRFRKPFFKVLKNLYHVRTKDIFLIGLKENTGHNTEILFAVKNANTSSYFSRRHLREILRKAESQWLRLSSESDHRIILSEDPCLKTKCAPGGKCTNVILMDEQRLLSHISEFVSFLTPNYTSFTFCECKEGFDGDKCDVIVNECSKDPCSSFQICVPDSSFTGYSCNCPSGFLGPLCNIESSSVLCTLGKCSLVNPLTFNGQNSFAEFHSKVNLEKHLSLSLNFKTLSSFGVLFYSGGKIDYILLEIAHGKLVFRFDLGSGEGLVALSSLRVNDGYWHEIHLERRSNRAKLTLNGTHEAVGSAPGLNDILDIESNRLFFGAQVTGSFENEENEKTVLRGFTGCLDDIRLDDTAVPLHEQENTSVVVTLIRLTNVEFKCEVNKPGPCGAHPCFHGGTCIEKNSSYYNCECSERFFGAQCQNDYNPCASNPCFHGGKCHNLKNDFHCECSGNISGKRCDYGHYCNPNPCKNNGECEEGSRGYNCKCTGFTGPLCNIDINECLLSNPCFHGGTCINSNGGFHCICPFNTSGLLCNDVFDSFLPSYTNEYLLNLEEVVGVIASLFGFVLLFIVILLIQRFHFSKKRKIHRRSRSRRPHSSLHSTDYGLQTNCDDEYEIDEIEDSSTDKLALQFFEKKKNSRDDFNSQTESHFHYLEAIRSYGSAGEELETTLPRPRSELTSFVKPICSVAPSIVVTGEASAILSPSSQTKRTSLRKGRSRNCAYKVFSPENSQEQYYWDSFDLTTGVSEVPLVLKEEEDNDELNSLNVDIETLQEEFETSRDEGGGVHEENEGPLGSLGYHGNSSFEHLLRNEIGFVDEEEDFDISSQNNTPLYLPSHEFSETEEQTPMLERHRAYNLNVSFSHLSSNDSQCLSNIPPLPPPLLNYTKYSSLYTQQEPFSSPICELDDDEDNNEEEEEASKEGLLSSGPRVTRV